MKQLKDYLHLYLGCELQIHESGEEAFISTLIGFDDNAALAKEYAFVLRWEFSEVKPILRPLSDMTDEERHKAYTIRGINAFNEFEGRTVRFLLSKHFDLFGLIEAGLAIDKTTLE